MSDGKYPNSGILFKNDRKGNNPKAPDYQGNAEVDGVEYRLSAWVKDGRKGKFLSLSFKTKEEDDRRQQAHRDDDDIPF